MIDALAIHYAQALANAVLAPGSSLKPDEALQQLSAAVDLTRSSTELRHVLQSPAVPREKKTEIIRRLLEENGADRLIRNFLMVIVVHRRVTELQNIRDSFEQVIDERQGFVRAEIVSARELTGEQKQELLHALGTATGKFIRPVYSVDPSLLGGVIARVGSKEYNGSVIGRLEAMRRRLATAS
jgi:F-type H+-transporting ATPase subunit delta